MFINIEGASPVNSGNEGDDDDEGDPPADTDPTSMALIAAAQNINRQMSGGSDSPAGYIIYIIYA